MFGGGGANGGRESAVDCLLNEDSCSVTGSISRASISTANPSDGLAGGAEDFHLPAQQHVIPAECIHLCKELGRGEFGCVYQAAWRFRGGINNGGIAGEKADPNDFTAFNDVLQVHFKRFFNQILENIFVFKKLIIFCGIF